MKVKALDHITINLKEVEKSFEFYETLFGCEKINTIEMGEKFNHFYRLSGNVRLELLQYNVPKDTISGAHTDLGKLRHFAVVVDSVDEAKAICDKMGYKINMQPTFVEKIQCKIMMIEDPNGVEIEVMDDAQEVCAGEDFAGHGVERCHGIGCVIGNDIAIGSPLLLNEDCGF